MVYLPSCSLKVSLSFLFSREFLAMTSAIVVLRQWHLAISHYQKHEPWRSRSIFKMLIRTLREFLKTNPDRQDAMKETLARLYFNLGVLMAYDGEFFLAGKAFQSSTKYRNDFVVSWYGRGLTEFRLGRYESGGKAFNKACSLMKSQKVEVIKIRIIDWRFLTHTEDFHPLGPQKLATFLWELSYAKVVENRRIARKMCDGKHPDAQRYQPDVHGMAAGFMLPPSDDLVSLDFEESVFFEVLERDEEHYEDEVKEENQINSELDISLDLAIRSAPLEYLPALSYSDSISTRPRAATDPATQDIDRLELSRDQAHRRNQEVRSRLFFRPNIPEIEEQDELREKILKC